MTLEKSKLFWLRLVLKLVSPTEITLNCFDSLVLTSYVKYTATGGSIGHNGSRLLSSILNNTPSTIANKTSLAAQSSARLVRQVSQKIKKGIDRMGSSSNLLGLVSDLFLIPFI